MAKYRRTDYPNRTESDLGSRGRNKLGLGFICLYGVPWYPPVRDVQQSNLQQSPSRDRGSHLRSASTHQKRYSIRIESRWNIKFKFDEEFEKWFHSEPFPSNWSLLFSLLFSGNKSESWKRLLLVFCCHFRAGKEVVIDPHICRSLQQLSVPNIVIRYSARTLHDCCQRFLKRKLPHVELSWSIQRFQMNWR